MHEIESIIGPSRLGDSCDRPATAFFPDLPETLHCRRIRDSVRSEAASDAVGFVGPNERDVRHAGEFPSELLQLRFIQPIWGHRGH